MLEREGWLRQAQEVREGQSKRVPHDCGTGSPMTVFNRPDGWSAWCHRCHDKGWEPKPKPSLEERQARQAAQEAADREIRERPNPPYPCVFDVQQWPLQARCWLYKAALFDEDIAKLGAYFHPPSQRVVLPVVADGKVVHYQARDVGLCRKGAAKYIGPKARAGAIIPHWGDDSIAVLTEDLLSAFRVGMAGEAVCLMGTVLHPPVARLLLLWKKPVAVWLDPDKAGDRGAGEVQDLLSILGIRNTKIVSEKDPKNLSRAEVAQRIEEARRGLRDQTNCC